MTLVQQVDRPTVRVLSHTIGLAQMALQWYAALQSVITPCYLGLAADAVLELRVLGFSTRPGTRLVSESARNRLSWRFSQAGQPGARHDR